MSDSRGQPSANSPLTRLSTKPSHLGLPGVPEHGGDGEAGDEGDQGVRDALEQADDGWLTRRPRDEGSALRTARAGWSVAGVHDRCLRGRWMEVMAPWPRHSDSVAARSKSAAAASAVAAASPSGRPCCSASRTRPRRAAGAAPARRGPGAARAPVRPRRVSIAARSPSPWCAAHSDTTAKAESQHAQRRVQDQAQLDRRARHRPAPGHRLGRHRLGIGRMEGAHARHLQPCHVGQVGHARRRARSPR